MGLTIVEDRGWITRGSVSWDEVIGRGEIKGKLYLAFHRIDDQ
jgi:hypothetical protein